MSVSFLKHYYNFSKTFYVILRSISGTGKVESVGLIIFNILGFPKIVYSLDLNKSTESTSTTAVGKLLQIITILLMKENFLRS